MKDKELYAGLKEAYHHKKVYVAHLESLLNEVFDEIKQINMRTNSEWIASHTMELMKKLEPFRTFKQPTT
jgi:transcriptional regulator NrdR family protein